MASTAARRSPRTRVRSLASIATSVPVPMASPRSARASAAASLTPSPTMATTRPSFCRRATTSSLSAGMHLGDDPLGSMPTSAATARAARSASPVSRTGVRPRARRPRTASATGRLDGVGDGRGDRAPRRPTPPPRRCVRRPRRPTSPPASSAGIAHRPVLEQPRPADEDGVAVDGAVDAEPLVVGELLDGWEWPVRALRAARRRWPGRRGARRRPRGRRRGGAPVRGPRRQRGARRPATCGPR